MFLCTNIISLSFLLLCSMLVYYGYTNANNSPSCTGSLHTSLWYSRHNLTVYLLTKTHFLLFWSVKSGIVIYLIVSVKLYILDWLCSNDDSVFLLHFIKFYFALKVCFFLFMIHFWKYVSNVTKRMMGNIIVMGHLI